MTPPRLLIVLGFLSTGLLLCGRAAEDRRERVLSDRREWQSDPHWIYNDLPRALAAAAETRKPMLVVFRCVP